MEPDSGGSEQLLPRLNKNTKAGCQEVRVSVQTMEERQSNVEVEEFPLQGTGLRALRVQAATWRDRQRWDGDKPE
jgi:hypothetical protein